MQISYPKSCITCVSSEMPKKVWSGKQLTFGIDPNSNTAIRIFNAFWDNKKNSSNKLSICVILVRQCQMIGKVFCSSPLTLVLELLLGNVCLCHFYQPDSPPASSGGQMFGQSVSGSADIHSINEIKWSAAFNVDKFAQHLLAVPWRRRSSFWWTFDSFFFGLQELY